MPGINTTSKAIVALRQVMAGKGINVAAREYAQTFNRVPLCSNALDAGVDSENLEGEGRRLEGVGCLAQYDRRRGARLLLRVAVFDCAPFRMHDASTSVWSTVR